MSINKKALAIDGNSMFYKMYYATLNQVEFALNKNWTPNNAIKLMLKNVTKLLSQNNYDYCMIAFDAHKQTFRHEILDTYKQGRTKTPDELIKQMNDCIICLKALGINVQQRESIEADDLVGSFSRLMNNNGVKVDVYSSDKDLLQLVNRDTSVHLMKTGISILETYDINNFCSKFFNLEPYQVIEYKAIIGDNSDRLPGIKGIGPKTGVDLLKKYQTLDNIYNHLSELSTINQQRFIDNKELAYKCKKMATILTDLFLDNSISEFMLLNYDFDVLDKIIDKYKLNDFKSYVDERRK